MAKSNTVDLYKFINLLESISTEGEQLQLASLRAYSKGVPISDIEIPEEMMSSALSLRSRLRECTAKIKKM